MTERLALPYTTDAEVAVLGAAMQDADAARLVASELSAADFTDEAHQIVWRSIASLIGRHSPVTLVTVYQDMAAKKTHEAVRPHELAGWVDAVPTTAHVAHYCQLIKRESANRRVGGVLTNALTRLQNGTEALVVASELTKDLADTCGRSTTERVVVVEHVSDVLSRFMTQWDDGPEKVLSTPYKELNEKMDGGMRAGNLVVMGARPAVGKSAMALEIAHHIAAQGTGALIVSREMVNTENMGRLLSQATKIPSSVIRRGTLTKDQWDAMFAEYGRVKPLPLWMTDAAVTLDEITNIVHGWSEDEPIGFLVVDYLQLVRAPKDIQQRRLQVEAVSSGLKELALSAKIPVLCLSSLRRPTGESKESKPVLADLRESGEVEHDADIVWLLHRKVMESETECIVAKNRNGACGTVYLDFAYSTLSFSDSTPKG